MCWARRTRGDLGSGVSLDDRQVAHLGRPRRGRQGAEHRAVGHVELQLIGPGAHVAAIAGERRAGVEEEARVDHALTLEQIADLARGRMRRDRDGDAAVARTVERLQELDEEPDHASGEHQREQRQHPDAPGVAAFRLGRLAWASRAPGALGDALALKSRDPLGPGGELVVVVLVVVEDRVLPVLAPSGPGPPRPRVLPVLRRRSPSLARTLGFLLGGDRAGAGPLRAPALALDARRLALLVAAFHPLAHDAASGEVSWAASHPSSRWAAARESSLAWPPVRSASRVVNRSS